MAIVGNGRDLNQPLQVAVQQIIGSYLPDVGELLEWIPVLEASPLFGPLEGVEATFEQYLDAEGRAERIGTISYVACLPDEERAEVLARARELGEAQPETPFPFRYQAEAVACMRRDAD